MAYFVSPGRSITSRRGMLNGGDLDSKVTWQDFVKDHEAKGAKKLGEEQIARLLEAEAIVKSDTIPITKAELEAAERLKGITQESSELQRLSEKKLGVKGRAKLQLEKMVTTQTVDMSGDPEAEAGPVNENVPLSEEAEAKAAAEAKAEADAQAAVDAEAKKGAKAGAQKAGDPLAPAAGGD